MHRSAISHARLMRESTDRVESALRSDDDKEHLVAHRILESPRTWELWECEHSGLMRQVAEYSVLQTQAAALRHTALRLIHGKALFEYLRRHSVRGAERAQILRHFYPTRGHRRAWRLSAQGLQLPVREPRRHRRGSGPDISRSHAALRRSVPRIFRPLLQHAIPARRRRVGFGTRVVAAAQAPAHRMAMDNPQPATERAASQT
jgi:hypothetical protein